MIKRLFLIVFLAAIGIAGWLVHYADSPMSGATYPLAFSVERGSTLRVAARDMAATGVLHHPWAFILLARIKGHATSIKAGSYTLSAPATPLALLRKITEGETDLGKLTVPEGWSFKDMRAAIDAHPGLAHDSAGLTTEQLMATLGAADQHPEGRFFPDTYFFDLGSSEIALYRRAYQSMQQHLDQAWANRAPNLPYRSPDDVLTMASIIEKETGAPEERPQIASVFVNRLRIGMRLQTDPTVIYGLGEDYDGNLRRDDLLTDTPYNTYTRAGLPPTPIALPGLAALRAAVHPDSSRYLYFVAKGSGRHAFSENLETHNRNVNRYQRGR